MSGKLVKAVIYELDKKNDKEKVSSIEVCFNPSSYSLEKTVTYNPSSAFDDTPVQQYGAPVAMELSVELKFDTYEERVSVRDKWVAKIEKLTMMKGKANDETDVKEHSPPVILFVWGKLAFQGVITQCRQNYTMFLSDGLPVRADVSLKIRQAPKGDSIDGKAQGGNHSNQGVGYTFKEGERFDNAAAKLGLKASEWRKVVPPEIDNPKDQATPGLQITVNGLNGRNRGRG